MDRIKGITCGLGLLAAIILLSWAPAGTFAASELRKLLSNRTESIEFDDKKYILSWIDLRGRSLTNEYRLKGDSDLGWKTLVTVRFWKGADAVKNILPKYLQSITPMLAAKPETFKKDKAVDDVVLAFFLLAPNKKYYEYNLHRFVAVPDGVKAYQYAQKLPFQEKLDVTTVLKKRNALITELGNLDIQTYEK